LGGRLIFGGSILLGLGAFAVVFILSEPDKIIDTIRQVGLLGCGLFFATCLVVYLIQTIGWQVLLIAQGHRGIKYRHLFVAMLMGQAGNYITPSMYIGGEPLRVVYLANKYAFKRRQIAATVIVHKMEELGGFLFLAYVGSVMALLQYGELIPPVAQGLIIFADIGLGAFFVIMAVGFFRNAHYLVRLMNFLARIHLLPQRVRNRIVPKVEEMEDLIHHALVINWKATLLSLALTAGPQLLVIAKPWIFFVFLGRYLTASELILIFTLVQLVLSLQFTPGGLGIFEGGQVAIYALLGIGAHEAMGITSLIRVVDAIIIGTGLMLIVHFGMGYLLRPRKRSEKVLPENERENNKTENSH
jgi:uncharacterized protein (TIRG00374 family)